MAVFSLDTAASSPASAFWQLLVSIPDFPVEIPHFFANDQIFPQNHRNTLENFKESQVLPIRRFERWTETYPILETFLFLMSTRSFSGVGGNLELLKAAKKWLTQFIRKRKKSQCFWRKIMESTEFSRKTYRIFLQNLWQICGFQADIEG